MGQAWIMPPRSVMYKTSIHDPIDYYYRPITGPIYRARFPLSLKLLGPSTFGSMLEVGYGSGVFLPELSRHCQSLSAVDSHAHRAEVERMLQNTSTSATLTDGDIMSLEYADESFDSLVCLSVLEHLPPTELHKAVGEMRRVSRPDGTLILGFPVRNPVTDAFFALVGYNPRELHPSGHQDIIRALHAGMASVEVNWWPKTVPVDLSLYVVCRCTPAS
ncbi:MAG: class I SAM-dependent methyltransferase [Chloroflexota bacterium]